jgi:hypothetical protein
MPFLPKPPHYLVTSERTILSNDWFRSLLRSSGGLDLKQLSNNLAIIIRPYSITYILFKIVFHCIRIS